LAEKPSARSATPPERTSFEEAIERLENIVEDLEGGSLTLEESIARYEEGVRLSKRLTQTLDEAEKRIERLVQSEEGAPPTTTPMEIEDPNGAAEAASRERDDASGRERAADERTTPAMRPERAPGGERREPPAPRESRASRSALPPDELPF
jgi:exodeoxyribonuclease VII small subunit